MSVKSGKNNEEPCVTLSNGVTVNGLLTTIKALVRFSEKDCNFESSLLGQGLLEQAEVEQWLEYCLRQITPCLNDATEIKDQLY
ncbi:hypothetical protein, partial [Salmonella sp. s54412]|uniref:hypothetical protein n=1 Tax=Salmonella sp. s54412 TaxID=3160128 RepID=UPI0037543698